MKKITYVKYVSEAGVAYNEPMPALIDDLDKALMKVPNPKGIDAADLAHLVADEGTVFSILRSMREHLLAEERN